MLKLIKDSFGITNKYIILATPLILFSLLSSLYLLFSINGSKIGLAIAAVLFVLMFGAFLSGWLYMTTRCVKNSEDEDINGLIKEFPAGVGEYFLPTLCMVVISFILGLLLFILSMIIGVKAIGDPQIPQTAFSASMNSVGAMKKFAASLTNEQLIKVNLWNLLLFCTMALNYFLVIFYAPAIFMKNKNPFIAFGIALRDLFSRKFFKNILLYIFVSIIYLVLSALVAIFGGNVFMHFVFTLVNFYFIVFAAVLIFNYYYINFIKIGGNVDKTV